MRCDQIPSTLSKEAPLQGSCRGSRKGQINSCSNMPSAPELADDLRIPKIAQLLNRHLVHAAPHALVHLQSPDLRQSCTQLGFGCPSLRLPSVQSIVDAFLHMVESPVFNLFPLPLSSADCCQALLCQATRWAA